MKVPSFRAGDFLELEEHLSAQHLIGQKYLPGKNYGKLSFTGSEPQRTVYRLDYVSEGMRREDWLAGLTAAGWESCGKLRGWECLRRAADTEVSESELLHDTEDRAKWCRNRADRETILGILPMVLFFLAGSLIKNTAYAEALTRIALLLILVAAAVGWPAYQVRLKCNRVIRDCQQAKQN